MKYILLFIILFISLRNVYGQSITWQKRLIIPYVSFPDHYSGLELGDGSFIVTLGATLNGPFTIKFSKYGDSLWSKINLGSYVLDTINNSKIILPLGDSIKIINNNGNLLNKFDLIEDMYVSDVKSKNADIYLCGTFPFIPYICKYDTSGSLKWRHLFDQGNPQGDLDKLFIDNNNNIYTSGSIVRNGSYGILQFFKLKEDGSIIFQKEFSDGLYAESMFYYNDSNIFICGSRANKMFLFKTNSAGDSLWLREYDINSYHLVSIATDIIVNNDFIYLLSYYENPNFYNGVRLSKMNLDGDFIWNKYYGDTNEVNYPYSMSLCKDSGFIICNDVDEPERLYHIIKTDKDGNTGNLIGIQEKTSSIDIMKVSLNPNPTNSQSILKFSLANKEQLKIKLFDIQGRQLKTIFDDEFIGNFSMLIDLQGFSSSIYFITIQFSNTNITKKLILIK